MIYYNSNTINEWNFGDDNIIKVYKHNAVVYYKFDSEQGGYKVCFAVVDDISQYTDREFEDVYDKATEKWYKLNNLNQYEQYGVYGSGRTITYYDGKLTVDDGYEYQYSGNSWVNVGEVSGSTATLPDVPFVLNYNARQYNVSTHTIPYTEGALNAIDAVITGTTANIIDHHEDGYIQLTGSSSTAIRALVGTTNFSRSPSNPNITIICKAYTPGSSTEGNILSNRKESYNWMYRHKSTQLRFHGQSEQGSIAVSNTEPNTCSVRIDSNRLLTYNNWTQNTTSSYSNFSYGSNSNGGALFSGYYSSTGEFWKGVFYWIYMSLNTLTDEQVQQVIAYNEGGGGQTEYPVYYDEKSAPLDNLTFNTLEDAEAYAYSNCVYDGMKATINGSKYYFDSDEGWVYKPSRLPSGYTELQYFTLPQNGSYATTAFNIKNKMNTDYKYSISFTPLDWEANSYYKHILGGDGSNNAFSSIWLYSLDNGWGDIYHRVWACLYNYNIGNGTQLGGGLVGAYAFHDNAKATVTMFLPNGVSGNGATIVVENEGYQTYSGTNTSRTGTVITDNVEYDMPIFTRASYDTNGATKVPYCHFYYFRVQDSLDNDIYYYLPVIRDSDNKVGLFDIVKQEFYYPTNFNFVAGPQV